ncbi:MAG: glycosyltransferase family 4 protein [Candidatus Krumholzibacteria bacterium]|nr:glycosyltransferase family 4 protein [Candidatus Krumholzibacteria bacterium]
MNKLCIYHIGTRGIPTTQGGIERHIEEIVSRQAEDLDITVYARKYYVPPMKEYRGVRIRRLSTMKTKHLDTWVYALIATLDVLFRRRGVVHYHALGPSLFAWIPRLFGHKTVVTVHGLDWQRGKWNGLARFYLRLCEIFSVRFPNRTIVVSRVLKEYYLDKYRADTECIPNGIGEPPSREPSEIRKKWGLEKDGYIFFIARLTVEKGAHHLIRAYRELYTDKKLVIAGEGLHSGRYVDELHKMAKEDERIIFTGFVSGSTLDELFDNCFLYCQPSEIEGLSIALLEAMSYGCCVLSSDIPENLELVQGVGFRFRNKDVEDLTLKLGALLERPEKVGAAGMVARRRALSEYSWDTVASATQSLYESLIKP